MKFQRILSGQDVAWESEIKQIPHKQDPHKISIK